MILFDYSPIAVMSSAVTHINIKDSVWYGTIQYRTYQVSTLGVEQGITGCTSRPQVQRK